MSTTVATPDRMNRMNTTLVMRNEQPARPGASDALLVPSRRGDELHPHRTPISMSSKPSQPANTSSELLPVDKKLSPINTARFCSSKGAPEMMERPKVTMLAAQIAAEKNADVLRVLTAAKKPLTPTEIAWAIERGGGTWAVKPKDGFAHGVADTALVCAVMRRIGAVRAGYGLWLKPGAKAKGEKK